jgi:hypothetical protein
MNYLAKTAGWNLLAILVYSLLIRIISFGMSGNDHGMSIAIFSAIAVFFHVVICLVVTVAEFSSKRPVSGRAWLLSSLIVLVVGFSACLGNASL